MPKEGREVESRVSILRYVGIDLRTLKDKDEADDIKKARELIKEREKK
jgi:hypothetical protein